MPTFERIYVAGCGGMLGEAVHAACSATATVAASDLAPRASWLDRVDVSDVDEFGAAVEAFRPDLLVNLAAMTDLEQCERDPDRAHATNALGTEHGAKLASRLGVPYVCISTAGIFDGQKMEYSDDDEGRPLTVYGSTKWEGEVAARSAVAERAFDSKR